MKKLSNDRLFMYCCVIGTIIFTWWGAQACWNQFDELLLIIYAVGCLCVPFIVQRLRWLNQ